MHSGWDGIRGFAKAILQEAFGQSYSKPVGHGGFAVLRGDPDGANIGVAQMVLGGAEDFSTDPAKGVAWTRVNISQDAEATERAGDLFSTNFFGETEGRCHWLRPKAEIEEKGLQIDSGQLNVG